jgi:hypothetical protein
MSGLFALARKIQGFPPADPPKFVAIPGDPQPIITSLATEVLHPVIARSTAGCEVATLEIVGKGTFRVALLGRNNEVATIEGQAPDRKRAMRDLREKLCRITPRRLRLIQNGETIVPNKKESRRLCGRLRILLNDQHRITITKETVTVLNRFCIGFTLKLSTSHKGRYHHN